MTDIIFNAPSVQHLVSAAIAMGFYEAPSANHPQGRIISTGVIPGEGGWFYNYVGQVQVPTGNMVDAVAPTGQTVSVHEMTTLSGVWGRLRHNGDPQYLPKLPANSGVTLYTYVPGTMEVPGFWSSDGVTPAPAYVANIGQIL